jgi:hypothetical protein
VVLLRAQLNDKSLYEKPPPSLVKAGFSAAYVDKNAHQPLIHADSDPGFYRMAGNENPMWRESKSQNSLGNQSRGVRPVTPCC